MKNAVLSSSSLAGDDVVDSNGDKLGSLKEIMIDIAHGDVAYAVLSRGGLAGIGQKLFAVPWQMFVVDLEDKKLILDVSADVLDNSAGFDPDNWPSFSDEWRAQVHEYYGLDSYREDGDLSAV